MNDLVRGAIAGLSGTAVMSAAMAVAKAVGVLPGEPPPRKVGRRFEESIGVRQALPQDAFEASWLVQHFAYGAAAGIAYELAERRLKLPEPIPSGPLFGAALWVFGYAGWLPLTGLYPSPPEEPARRVGTLIATHLIFGTATAATSRLLPRRKAALPSSRLARGPITASQAAWPGAR